MSKRLRCLGATAPKDKRKRYAVKEGSEVLPVKYPNKSKMRKVRRRVEVVEEWLEERGGEEEEQEEEEQGQTLLLSSIRYPKV